jgi:hypothetical protein
MSMRALLQRNYSLIIDYDVHEIGFGAESSSEDDRNGKQEVQASLKHDYRPDNAVDEERPVRKNAMGQLRNSQGIVVACRLATTRTMASKLVLNSSS